MYMYMYMYLHTTNSTITWCIVYYVSHRNDIANVEQVGTI